MRYCSATVRRLWSPRRRPPSPRRWPRRAHLESSRSSALRRSDGGLALRQLTTPTTDSEVVDSPSRRRLDVVHGHATTTTPRRGDCHRAAIDVADRRAHRLMTSLSRRGETLRRRDQPTTAESRLQLTSRPTHLQDHTHSTNYTDRHGRLLIVS